MFIRNSWYVVAWADEVSRDRPLGRTLLDEPVVLFRTTAGEVAALEGRCAHRRMPLAHARLEGDRLVCCYHGLVYDATGACVRVPGQDRAPATLRVRAYPAVERYGAIWLWMGDPDRADASKIFDCARIDADGANGHRFYFHARANWLYLNDNLSDLLHQAYLHSPSFGGNTDPLGETRPSITQEGDRIRVEWDWKDVPVPGTFGEIGGINGRADGWNHSFYAPPSFYINSPGFAEAGTGGIDSTLPQGAGKVGFTIYQLITPETLRSTHFFKIVHCDWPATLLPRLRTLIEPVNLEDVWACEEQQRMEDLGPATPMHAIATDRPVVAMRRIVERLYREERGSSS